MNLSLTTFLKSCSQFISNFGFEIVLTISWPNTPSMIYGCPPTSTGFNPSAANLMVSLESGARFVFELEKE